jgi:NAD(P)-dependent dehydrogenase (short-subunit alcohol dehydrogenase family)
MESLNGKVAVVTGGASGIGRALSLAFAREGARVVVADLDDAGMADTVAEVARAGSAAIAVRTDVSRLEQVQALADRAFAEMGAVHVLCNNAGVALWGGLESATHRDWEWAIGVNLWGVIHGVETFVPRMIAQHVPGHIVNTGVDGRASSPPRDSASTTRRSMRSWDCPRPAEGPARLWDRRLRPLPHGGQDGDPPERAEPTRRPAQCRRLGQR